VRIVIDAYAWIGIFIGSRSGEKAKEVLERAEETYTPDIIIAEIALKYLREGMGEEIILERLTAMDEASEILSGPQDLGPL
jgi:predicted nucleic acid-binding protein